MELKQLPRKEEEGLALHQPHTGAQRCDPNLGRTDGPRRPLSRKKALNLYALRNYHSPQFQPLIALATEPSHCFPSTNAGPVPRLTPPAPSPISPLLPLPTVSCSSQGVAAIDGRPLGDGRINFVTEEVQLRIGTLHSEPIRLFVLQSPKNPIILGFPWLEKHNPTISWNAREITRSQSDFCKMNCLSNPPSPPSKQSPPKVDEQDSLQVPGLPDEYLDLALAFSKARASQLPPHRASDCAIDLIPGSLPPKGRVFPLSQPESEAMQAYIEEELAKGFIRPSTSPVSAGFFFVKKKDFTFYYQYRSNRDSVG
ncbi:hypothetical protein QQF64_020805 [Cirrhinus molitorella]|uniref:Uncharacterized protein n=1 Tax=Cirrhinus molitorella TaxID=172907 RepID=A0ABR3LA75_9TELE